jgi:transcriptional regulator with XRE-family HTH domain
MVASRRANPGAPLAGLIREARKRRGMTQQGLAREIGVSQPEIARWESGRVSDISLHNRHRLAEAGISRIALGLASFSLDKVEADIDAAIDETLKLGKPSLGARLLTPGLSWLNYSWHEDAADQRRVGQQELASLARGNFVAGLIGSLTLPSESRARLISTLETAENFAHRLKDEESRIDIVSHSLLINGNERRKAGNFDGAEYFLAKAESWAANGQLWRRKAEIAGLLCYVQAAQGDTYRLQSSLKRSEAALQQVSSGTRVESADTVTGGSLFDATSFAEVQLRCALMVRDRIWIKQLCRDAPPHLSENYHWELYYSLTRGAAQLWLRDSEGIQWLCRARDIAVRVGAVSQLQRILMAARTHASIECAELADKVRADLDSLHVVHSPPSGERAQSWQHNLF